MNIDITIIAIYLAFTLIVGIYKGRGVSNVRDYAISDRNYSTPVLVATIFGTLIGGGSTLGVTESIYAGGIFYLVLFLFDPITKIIISEFVAPKMAQYYDLISVGDIMERSYGRAGKMFTGLAGFILLGGLLGAQIGGLGAFLHYFTGFTPLMSTLIGASIVVLYSAFGGIRSVTATDVIQFGVIIIAIPVVANVALMDVGGAKALLNSIPEEKFVFWPEDKSKLTCITLFIMFMTPLLNPAVMQRLLMARDTKQMITSMRISAALDYPFYLTMGIIAFSILVLNPNLEPKMVFPYLVGKYLPTGIQGIAIAGMLAVIMSTADSYLNAASVSFVHDFIRPLKRNKLTDKQELNATRLVTVVLGLFSIVVAVSFKSILDIIISFQNIWAFFIVIPLYSTIWGIRANKTNFFVGIAGSLITYTLLKLFAPGVMPLLPVLFGQALFFYTSVWLTNKKNGTTMIRS